MVALVAAVLWSQKNNRRLADTESGSVVGEYGGVEGHPHIHKLQFNALNYPLYSWLTSDQITAIKAGY